MYRDSALLASLRHEPGSGPETYPARGVLSTIAVGINLGEVAVGITPGRVGPADTPRETNASAVLEEPP